PPQRPTPPPFRVPGRTAGPASSDSVPRSSGRRRSSPPSPSRRSAPRRGRARASGPPRPGDRRSHPTRGRARLSYGERPEILGRAPRLRGLLERVRELNERRLAPGAPHERDADRKAHPFTPRHADERIAGERRALRAAAAELIAVDEVDRPRRRRRGRHHRVEAVLIHGDVEAFLASQPAALLERLQVFGVVETTL